MMSSTIYTIGTAMIRARDSGVGVEVLVDGHWVTGDVSAVDGHGVVLHTSDGSLAMIRIERIDVVLVRQTEAFESGGQGQIEQDAAHPMPAPVADDQATEPQVVRPRTSIERAWDHRDTLVRGA